LEILFLAKWIKFQTIFIRPIYNITFDAVIDFLFKQPCPYCGRMKIFAMIKSLGRGEDPHKAPSSITDNIHFSPSEIVSHKDASDINPIQSNPEWTV
jgi:hypothetical protein